MMRLGLGRTGLGWIGIYTRDMCMHGLADGLALGDVRTRRVIYGLCYVEMWLEYGLVDLIADTQICI